MPSALLEISSNMMFVKVFLTGTLIALVATSSYCQPEFVSRRWNQASVYSTTGKTAGVRWYPGSTGYIQKGRHQADQSERTYTKIDVLQMCIEAGYQPTGSNAEHRLQDDQSTRVSLETDGDTMDEKSTESLQPRSIKGLEDFIQCIFQADYEIDGQVTLDEITQIIRCIPGYQLGEVVEGIKGDAWCTAFSNGWDLVCQYYNTLHQLGAHVNVLEKLCSLQPNWMASWC